MIFLVKCTPENNLRLLFKLYCIHFSLVLSFLVPPYYPPPTYTFLPSFTTPSITSILLLLLPYLSFNSIPSLNSSKPPSIFQVGDEEDDRRSYFRLCFSSTRHRPSFYLGRERERGGYYIFYQPPSIQERGLLDGRGPFYKRRDKKNKKLKRQHK